MRMLSFQSCHILATLSIILQRQRADSTYYNCPTIRNKPSQETKLPPIESPPALYRSGKRKILFPNKSAPFFWLMEVHCWQAQQNTLPYLLQLTKYSHKYGWCATCTLCRLNDTAVCWTVDCKGMYGKIRVKAHSQQEILWLTGN